MRFVVVTGMSGSGKSTAMKFLEDAGFFCVDNLPVPLIEKFMELLTMPNNEISKAALGLDVRAEQTFGDAIRILDRMRQNGFVFEILFMDAGDDTRKRSTGSLCRTENIITLWSASFPSASNTGYRRTRIWCLT